MVKIFAAIAFISVGFLFYGLHLLARRSFRRRWDVRPRTLFDVVEYFGSEGEFADKLLLEWEEECGIPIRRLNLETPLRLCVWPSYGVFSQPILDCCGDVLNPSEKENLDSCEILIREILKRVLSKRLKT